MIKKIKLLVLVINIGLVTSSCSSLFYQPSKENFHDPKKFRLVYEDVYLKSKNDSLLHGWFFPVDSKTTELGTVVQFHGNAENISTHFLSLVWIVRYGYNLFIFDYQGYGQSQGVPNQAKINEDALTALEYIIKRNSKLKLIAYGQSLGGTILLKALDDFSDKKKIDAVVIDSSFSSYQEIGKEKLSMTWITFLFQPLAYILISDRYAPKRIYNISPIPLLVIHGDNDSVVPIHHGKNIFNLAKEPKWFWHIKGGKHIDSMTSHNGIYRDKLLNFFKTL